MATNVPGLIGDGDYPPATEITCISVSKVYDSCTQTVLASESVPIGCLPCDCIPRGTKKGSLACNIDLDASSCDVAAIVSTGVGDINSITYTIAAVVNLICPNGQTDSVGVYDATTVDLYNPSGTTPACTIVSGICSAVILPNCRIAVKVRLCLWLQTLATVQLLVPSYGYCVPRTCQVSPLGIRPPASLLSPQG